MKGDRDRVPLENDYAVALGRAIVIFARLEWSAVNCCERMEPNSYHGAPFGEKTPRKLAKKLRHFATELPPSEVQNELRAAATEFNKLRKTRNKLLHVQPISTTEGSQRLVSDGVAWTVETIDDAADAFTECNDRFVALRDKLPLPQIP